MDYITRGVCGQEGCRETRYYLDNGLWFCRRGHQQEGRQIEEDPEDYALQGRTVRVKKAAAEKSQKKYRGRQASRLFLQVYQLILWKQCHAFVHGQGFPAQLEHVVRDLWALRLQSFSEKLDDPLDIESDPEVFSSQQETDTDVEGAAKFRARMQKWPRLVDTVALCYIAALLMRLPVTVGDIYRMVMRGDIPYTRIVRIIPREMRDKIPGEYTSILEPKGLLKAGQLHHAVQELILSYHRKFDMRFPPLNWPIMLFHYIKRLALPIEIYPTVKNIQKLANFPFSFPTTIIKKQQRKLSRSPDVQLMSLIVIATKLLFPFDKMRRYPVSANEPTTQAIDWKAWDQAQRHFDDREASAGHIGRGREVLTTEKDVFSMTPTQLDEYMDWYECSWLDECRVSNPLADLFPIGRSGAEPQPAPHQTGGDDDDEALSDMLHAVMGQLIPRKHNPSSDSDIPRPGCEYRRYRTESDLPDTARPFYETVAKLAGISLNTLVRAVFQTELKLSQWRDDRRRGEMYGEGGMEVSDSDEEY